MSVAPNPIDPDRVTERRKALGMTQAELARLIGSSQQAIDMIERGKVRRPKRLHEIAKALETDPEYLIGGKSNPSPEVDGVAGPVPLSTARPYYGGVVRAGEFLPVDDDFNQDAGDHLVPLGVMPHPAYPHLRQGAWLVSGDSMNDVGVLDGMWVVGPSYADWVDQYGELGNGNLVVVERTRAGGSERELTVKEVQFARRGMRLVPRSTNPKYQEFFIPLDEEADSDTETVQILAVVLWFGRDINPMGRR